MLFEDTKLTILALKTERNLDYFGAFLTEVSKTTTNELTLEQEISGLNYQDLLWLAEQDTIRTYQELAIEELDRRTAST